MDAPQKTSTDKENTDGYVTVVDEGDMNAAFAFSTQLPLEDNLPPVEEKEEEVEEENKEEKEVELDKEDKEKPRAKPTKVYESQPRRLLHLAKTVTARDSQTMTCSSAAIQIQKTANSVQEDNDKSSMEKPSK